VVTRAEKKFHYWPAFVVVVLLLVGLSVSTGLVRLPGRAVVVSLLHLPYYGLCSFYRMLAAYLLALLFSVSYGYAAAINAKAERVMMPLLDILQSVPVLGFFPAAVYFFVNLFHGHRLGVELASIFLIFTGQAWNMAFGVYEAITTLPDDSKDAMQSLGVKGWLCFRRLYLPAAVPKLVYNSVLSWAGGWYFLIACEIIALGPVNYHLPGLGSFLAQSTLEGKLGLTFAALALLIAMIVVLDLYLWRPLTLWADRFRYEFAVAPVTHPNQPVLFNAWRHVQHALRRSRRRLFRKWARYRWFLRKLRQPVTAASEKILFRLGHFLDSQLRRGGWKTVKRVGAVAAAALALLIVVKISLGLVTLLTEPFPGEAKKLPGALLLSTSRLAVAYGISLLWTIPAAGWIGENERISRVLMPVLEIAASVPATALFPIMVLVVIHTFGGMNFASILLVLTGMQWYLAFNLVAGVRNVPGDLKEAARAFGLSRWQYWRKVLLPAMVPSLITGSITAWGGGWNALIVSEYLVYKGQTYSVLGIGALLDEATYQTGNSLMMLLTLLVMVAAIILLNRFFWRKLYHAAARRYRIEY